MHRNHVLGIVLQSILWMIMEELGEGVEELTQGGHAAFIDRAEENK